MTTTSRKDTKKTARQASRAKRPAKGATPESTLLEAGPRKKRKSGPPLPRTNRHKARAAWFRARVGWPLREASVRKLVVERRRAKAKMPSESGIKSWQQIGPTNIGGRCTSLVCHPTDADRLWIGAAGGGVWMSSNAGQTWTNKWPASAPLEIGALAIDPSNPGVLYCGTGEANLSADSYAGDGLYRSVNGGKSWKSLARSAATGVPRRIGTIAVDPFDSKHLLLGGIGYGRMSADNDFGGLYSSKDGGVTWQRETVISSNNYWCHCIVFDPSAQGIILATFTGPGASNGLYRTTDGGGSWKQITSGLPSTDRIGRTSIAFAPSNPKIVYAISAEMASDSADQVLGVFRSINGGTSWTNIAGSHFKNEEQMSYGNVIAVHPTDPNHVLCGGVDLHLTTTGGGSWSVASHWDAERGTSTYAHADHHALVFAPSAPGRLYTANDGGLDASNDGGKSWQNRSNGLVVNMFYDFDVSQTGPNVFGGGAQDNGTLVTTNGSANKFFELLGGDGGWMVIDPKDAGHIFASFQFGGMYRFRKGSARKVSPPFKPDDSDGIWMVYITIDPNNSNTIYTGNQRVYRTKNDGLSWDALTPVLDGSPISAIEVAPANSKNVYVGTEDGGFFRSLDGGATWSANLASSTLPGVMITRIETVPTKANELVVTVGNFGNSHVFRSTDAGSTWLDIDDGKLPDVPHHALLIRPDAPQQMFVCNDAGVFVTKNDGATWANASAKLPNVMVVDLVYQVATKTLIAATYGRSAWKTILT
jgi:photosystem II stability/assembly factor-like uncharacterized protein